MHNGILKLHINKYDQMGSHRPLENAYHSATGRSCEIENEYLVLGSGELFTTTKQLRNWYKKRGNISSKPVTVIIDFNKKHSYIAENSDEIHDAHERKWRRYSITLYHNGQEKEFTNFGEEYSIDEIKARADDLLEKYMPNADISSAAWKTSGQTHTKQTKQTGDYSVSIYVIP